MRAMGHFSAVGVCVGASLVMAPNAAAFSIPNPIIHTSHLKSTTSVLSSPAVDLEQMRKSDFSLTVEEIKPVMTFGSESKKKLLNSFGIWCGLVTAITAPIWLLAMKIVNWLVSEERDPHKVVFDTTGRIWTNIWLTLTNCQPTFSGQRPDENTGPCMYVANHASWLDIALVVKAVGPVFKFIAKGELTKFPFVGSQLQGGNHILLEREDRRSQLKSFKETVGWLKQGIPIVAFPEGTRSEDGRLQELKGGLFAMAAKAGVPIVPISLCHAAAVMPANALFPVQKGAGRLHVHIHDPISTEGRTDEELAEMVKQTFLDTLPECQLPLGYTEAAGLEVASDRKIVQVELDPVESSVEPKVV